jgi:hypothetical protein
MEDEGMDRLQATKKEWRNRYAYYYLNAHDCLCTSWFMAGVMGQFMVYFPITFCRLFVVCSHLLILFWFHNLWTSMKRS